MFDRVGFWIRLYKEMKLNISGLRMCSSGTLLTKIVNKNNLFEKVLPIYQIYQFINGLTFNR